MKAIEIDVPNGLLKEEPGWVGAFTRARAPNAFYGNGATVYKTNQEPGDSTPIATRGTVIGSISHPALGVLYFIEWANLPKHAVGVIGWKIGDGMPPS